MARWTASASSGWVGTTRTDGRRFGAAHVPSPDVRYGHPAFARSMLTARGGKFVTCPGSRDVGRRGRGSVLPMSRRRTLATGILPSARSMLTALRHPACAGQQRRLSGHGQPLTDDSYPSALGPEGRVSTSGRRPAKRKWQDAMFRVYTAHGQPLTDAPRHANSAFTGLAGSTPVSFESRPWYSTVNFAWSMPRRWSIVACRSRTWTTSCTAL